MRRIAFFMVLFFGCFVGTIRGQTGVIPLSVTTSPINITVNQSCNFVVVQENAASPSNAFTITLPGGSTGITYAAGTKFIFTANSNGYVSGQVIGTINLPSGTANFVGIESVSTPTLPAAVKSSGGGGGGGALPNMQIGFGNAGGTAIIGSSSFLFNVGTLTESILGTNQGSIVLGSSSATAQSSVEADGGSTASNAAPGFYKATQSPANAFSSYIYPCNGANITGQWCAASTAPTADSTQNLIQNVQRGTAAMTTAAITAGNCGATVTVSAAGVLSTDTIRWSFNAAPAGTNAGIVAWPTNNNVNFAYCPGVAETPAAATINWSVDR